MEAYKIRKAERTARLNTLFYLYIYNLFNNFIIMKKIIYETKEGEKYNYYASREEAYRSINYTSINHNNQLEINRILLLDNWDIEVIELYSLSDSIFNYDWIFRNLASFLWLSRTAIYLLVVEILACHICSLTTPISIPFSISLEA